VHRRQDGFKAHPAIEPDTGIVLLQGEPEPVGVLVDSAHGSGELRAELAAMAIDVVKPAPTRSAVPGGFTVDDYAVDYDARTATCPAGFTRNISPTGAATFKAACRGCCYGSGAPPASQAKR
jgi:hypothetical protein